jgi:NAD(P)-dependent dehydrogenase (short-subunit alcohol dehydrogenase family)
MSAKKRFQGKVVVVTGARSGIGLATAVRFSQEGAKVVLADIRDAEPEAAGIRKAGGDATFAKVDISREIEVEAMVAKTLAVYGRADVLVNNAATGPFKTVADTSEAELDRILCVNIKGTFLCCKAMIPVMKRGGGGVIVNVGSALGLVSAPGVAAYSASKGAVVQLTKALAVEHAADGIRANCVCPGPVRSDMMDEFIQHSPDPQATEQAMVEGTLLKRFGKPEEIAEVIVFMASAQSSNMTGSIVVADGGWTAI